MPDRKNILFVVIDQFRADLLDGALSAYVDLPNLRALQDEAVSFRNHFSVCNPCGPSRASILTGQYAMNHRSVRNGTPLPADLPNLATEARAAGYQPMLFGYTDTTQDPRGKHPRDPVLATYEEFIPGFDVMLEMCQEKSFPWRAHLAKKGHDVSDYWQIYRPKGPNPNDPAVFKAEDSDTAFLTDRVIEDLSVRPPGWFAHVTYIRPHPPLVAPAPYNAMYDPADVPPPVVAADAAEHPFQKAIIEGFKLSNLVVGLDGLEETPERIAQLRAVYLGLATEVDHHIGRLLQWLRESGQYDDTLIVVTADHGEMLGDHGQWGKMAYHDAAYHVPLIVRDPGGGAEPGTRISAPTESVDITPTLLARMGLRPPDTMDGCDLSPFLEGAEPDRWRRHTFSELDFGDPVNPTVWQRALGQPIDSLNFSILRTDDTLLVHFAGDLPQVLLDRTGPEAPVNMAQDVGAEKKLLEMTRKLLSHRMTNPDGRFARTLVTSEGVKFAES